MSDLGTNAVLAVSRAPGWTDFRYHVVHPLRAVMASTGFDASTGRKPGSVDPKALAFVVRRHRNINLFSV